MRHWLSGTAWRTWRGCAASRSGSARYRLQQEGWDGGIEWREPPVRFTLAEGAAVDLYLGGIQIVTLSTAVGRLFCVRLVACFVSGGVFR